MKAKDDDKAKVVGITSTVLENILGAIKASKDLGTYQIKGVII